MITSLRAYRPGSLNCLSSFTRSLSGSHLQAANRVFEAAPLDVVFVLMKISTLKSATSNVEFLEMARAIELLIEFGEAYSLAREVNTDTDGVLCGTTHMLLVLLTNQAARPEDLEEVFPHNELIADA